MPCIAPLMQGGDGGHEKTSVYRVTVTNRNVKSGPGGGEYIHLRWWNTAGDFLAWLSWGNNSAENAVILCNTLTAAEQLTEPCSLGELGEVLSFVANVAHESIQKPPSVCQLAGLASTPGEPSIMNPFVYCGPGPV